jgi:hypothetical protein
MLNREPEPSGNRTQPKTRPKMGGFFVCILTHRHYLTLDGSHVREPQPGELVMLNTTERLAVALRTLATETDVPGMLNPSDEQERERLAVSIIREQLAHAERLTERDRLTARVASGVRVFANGHDVSTATQRFAFAAEIIVEEQERTDASRTRGILFVRNVGNGLRLAWCG